MERTRKPLHPDERAVSQEIGAILMVAILVVMGVVVGTFVLDLGENVDQKPQVGVTFDEDPSSGVVTVRIDSIQRADRISIDGSDCGGPSDSTITVPTTGAAETVHCSTDGEIVVTATYDGNTDVVQTYDYED